MVCKAFHLPRSAEAPADARRCCDTVCDEGGLGHLAADCRLLVSEVVTNAVEHGSGAITLEMTTRPGAVHISVSSEAPAMPPTPGWPETYAVSGRGLAIVAAVAARWGTEHHRAGTRVWFELGR